MNNNHEIYVSNKCNFKNDGGICFKGNKLYSCEVFLVTNNWALLPKCSNPLIKSAKLIKTKIINKCSGKILIEGTLCKRIEYKSICNTKCRVITNQEFNCYINVDELLDNDKYKIVGCEVICDYTKHDFNKISCRKKCMLKDVNIVKVVVQRIHYR